jgi:acyl carrier protein
MERSATGSAGQSSTVLADLRLILADITSDDAALTAAPDTPLLRDGLRLDSLGGALLLVRVRTEFGVDVAGEDLNLDCLACIGTLAAFVADRIAGRCR